MFDSKNDIKIIGTRNGEKLYETLLTWEEMAHAEDLNDYDRIPADNRNLNYDKYFVEGEEKISRSEDYSSHNTIRLGIRETKDLLMSQDFIRNQVDA